MAQETINPNLKALSYWHLLLSSSQNNSPLNNAMKNLTSANGLPEELMDSRQTLNNLKKKFPDKFQESELDKGKTSKDKETEPDDGRISSIMMRRMLLRLKLIQDLFSPNLKNNIKAIEFNEWKKTVKNWENEMEQFTDPLIDIPWGSSEELPDANEQEIEDDETIQKEEEEEEVLDTETLEKYGKQGGKLPGQGFRIDKEEMENVFQSLETKIIKKMNIRELLKDEELYQKIQPSMSIVEELLFQKDRLSGIELKNAKSLIRRYVNKLAETLLSRVNKSIRKIPNPDIVPKKVFRNLDIKRTIWKNLPNWNGNDKKLYVDQVFFYRAGKKTLPSKIIVVVDQSGSMVEAMVQTTILASIFAGLPNVEVELFAFDTRVINLTKYVRDPLEVLMNTKLGGGTYINQAVEKAKQNITDPKNTAMVLITDYYEGGSDQVLFENIISIKEDGVTFISVASMNKRGHVYVNNSFVSRLKKEGIPTIMGNLDDLISHLRKFL